MPQTQQLLQFMKGHSRTNTAKLGAPDSTRCGLHVTSLPLRSVLGLHQRSCRSPVPVPSTNVSHLPRTVTESCQRVQSAFTATVSYLPVLGGQGASSSRPLNARATCSRCWPSQEGAVPTAAAQKGPPGLACSLLGRR